jgi:hypothetical protein
MKRYAVTRIYGTAGFEKITHVASDDVMAPNPPAEAESAADAIRQYTTEDWPIVDEGRTAIQSHPDYVNRRDFSMCWFAEELDAEE